MKFGNTLSKAVVTFLATANVVAIAYAVCHSTPIPTASHSMACTPNNPSSSASYRITYTPDSVPVCSDEDPSAYQHISCLWIDKPVDRHYEHWVHNGVCNGIPDESTHTTPIWQKGVVGPPC
jgi:hypothetical protein